MFVLETLSSTEWEVLLLKRKQFMLLRTTEGRWQRSFSTHSDYKQTFQEPGDATDNMS